MTSLIGRQMLDAQVEIARENQTDPILRFFAYDHLPAQLQSKSKPFHDLAHLIVETVPRNAERSVGLRKLLEAKDAVIRAGLPE